MRDAATTALLVALIPAMTLFGAGSAIGANPMKLEDLIGAALSGNLSIKREEAKVGSARGSAQEAAGAFDWTPVVQTGWQLFYVPTASNGFLTTGTTTINAVQSIAGVGRLFRNGIEVHPGITTYANVDASVGQTLGLTKTVPSLGLSIPLWQGLGEESADAQEHGANESLQATLLEQKFVTQQAVHDAVQVYWRCLAIGQQVKIFEGSARDASDYEQWMRTLAARGQADPTGTERASASQVVRRVAAGRAAEQLETCRRDLVLASGPPADGELPMPQGDLPAIDKMGPAVEALNESALTALALRQREDFRALERFVDAETALVRGAQDHLSPKLDLYLDTQRVYLRYTQSLHNDAAKGLVTKATAAESNARINVSELHTHIQLDIADVLRGLRGAWLDWQSLSQSLHRLEGVVGSYEKQAKAGAIDRADLLASQDQATEVRHELVDVRLRFASALATLRLVTGSLTVEGRTPAALAADFYTLPTP